MSLRFLAADAVEAHGGVLPLARSPMERAAEAAGARFEDRDGWRIAVSYGPSDDGWDRSGGWVDMSHLGKLEVQAPEDGLSAILATCTGVASLAPGQAIRAHGAWWCPLTTRRMLVLCAPSRLPSVREQLAEAAGGAGAASVVDVTTAYAGLAVVGLPARDICARFTAIDLRPSATPVAAVRPGSIGRQPGVILCEEADRFLLLFGWAVAEYMWTVVADAGQHLGARPVGLAALPALEDETRDRAAGRA